MCHVIRKNPYLYSMVAVSEDWLLQVRKWIIFYDVLSHRLSVAALLYILYTSVVVAVAQLCLDLKQLFISSVSSWLTRVIRN